MAASIETVSPSQVSTPSSSRNFQCGSCPKTFKRPEHLKRHEDTHASGRIYTCTTCGKGFARSDVLARHMYTHDVSRRAESRALQGTSQPRQPRACASCSHARERCSKDTPCDRCSIRSLPCIYPLPKRSKAGSKKNGKSRRVLSSSASTHTAAAGLRTSSADIENTANSSSTNQDENSADEHGTLRHMDSLSYSVHHDNGTGELAIDPQLEHYDHEEEISPQSANFEATRSGMMDLSNTGISYATPRFQSPIDLSMNWLPVSDTIDMNFSSILDLGLPPDLDLPMSPPARHGLALSTLLDPAVTCALDDGSRTQQTAGWSPATTSSNSGLSTSSLTSSKAAPGRLYATSSSARAPAFLVEQSSLPLVVGTKAQPSIKHLPSDHGKFEKLQFTPTSISGLRNALNHRGMEFEGQGLIWPSMYDAISHEFQRLCIRCDSHNNRPFTNDYFPSKSHLDLFVHLFHDKFVPAFPIFHHSSNSANDSWILTLAMAAIGCQYTKAAEFDGMVIPLHEFLLRALRNESETTRAPRDQVKYVQALLLSQIGHFYYGSSKLRSRALSRRGNLIHLAESLNLFAPEPPTSSEAPFQDGGLSDLQGRWQQWILAESKRRLAYSIWMLDVMTLYHFGVRPLLPHQVPQADLPHDALWTAPNEHSWWELFGRTERNPPLPKAIRKIFLEKEVKPDLGEFGRTILLHGIFHEINQVKTYFQRPLSAWVPAAQTTMPSAHADGSPQNSSSTSDQQWLQENEPFAAWRSAALDCVDTLHWWANGVIALQSGRENPTVHHLHFSRVVLLVPVKEIVCLIQSVTNQTDGSSHDTSKLDVHEAEQEVLRWAHRDESKARLAAIHCGCVFWHLRRFSTSAFYESQSVFLATLALWAYSYYVSQTAPPRDNVDHTMASEDCENQSPNGERSGSVGIGTGAQPYDFDEPAQPSFIWLDRPNDDEMVQYFVRSGRPVHMKAFISGVGDIYEPRSPARILREGRRILESVAYAWGRDRTYVDILQKAEQIMVDAEARQAS